MEAKAEGEITLATVPLSQILSEQILSSIVLTAPGEIPATKHATIKFIIKI